MNAHEHVVATLCIREGASRRGFCARLRKIVDSDLTWWRWRPDAFAVSHGLVTAYEVEDTHRLDMPKLLAYARLWKQLDDHDIVFKLVVVDIRGGTWEPDLGVAYYHA